MIATGSKVRVYNEKIRQDYTATLLSISEGMARVYAEVYGNERSVDAESIYPLEETVNVPAGETHQGMYSVNIRLNWVCPTCGKPRGSVVPTLSYDGSLRMVVDGWVNPCGHTDKYSACVAEAIKNGLNDGIVITK